LHIGAARARAEGDGGLLEEKVMSSLFTVSRHQVDSRTEERLES
jgi:hypothetical protein